MHKLTHGAERNGDSVHIPADHPTFPFPTKGDQQATAPSATGVHMIVSQLNGTQLEALGISADEAAPPAEQPPVQDSADDQQLATDGDNQQADGQA